jgi:hypothetical protein
VHDSALSSTKELCMKRQFLLPFSRLASNVHCMKTVADTDFLHGFRVQIVNIIAMPKLLRDVNYYETIRIWSIHMHPVSRVSTQVQVM